VEIKRLDLTKLTQKYQISSFKSCRPEVKKQGEQLRKAVGGKLRVRELKQNLQMLCEDVEEGTRIVKTCRAKHRPVFLFGD